MPEEHLPVYQIQDFHAQHQKAPYFYLSSFADHLQEHMFIQKPHKHNFFILLLITQGTGEHTIDFRTYPVQPHTVFFLTPGQVHSWQLTADTDGYILFFTPEFYLLGYPHRKLYNYAFFNPVLQKPFLTISPADSASLLQIFETMQLEHKQQRAMKEDLLRDYLDILLILLMRLYQPREGSGQHAASALPQFQAIRDLIEQHFKEHRPVSFYAEALHVTVKQLNEGFKRTIGKTMAELLKDRILLEAQRLLVHSSLTVTQVAAELGYFETAYFFRFFKKHVKQTPEQFRKAHQ